MKTSIFLLLIISIASTALANPCSDNKQRFERAKKFGATQFKCTSNYDGSATSSFTMTSENHKNFVASEIERKRQFIKGKKK